MARIRNAIAAHFGRLDDENDVWCLQTKVLVTSKLRTSHEIVSGEFDGKDSVTKLYDSTDELVTKPKVHTTTTLQAPTETKPDMCSSQQCPIRIRIPNAHCYIKRSHMQ